MIDDYSLKPLQVISGSRYEDLVLIPDTTETSDLFLYIEPEHIEEDGELMRTGQSTYTLFDLSQEASSETMLMANKSITLRKESGGYEDILVTVTNDTKLYQNAAKMHAQVQRAFGISPLASQTTASSVRKGTKGLLARLKNRRK